jgi:hypothetical protein
MEYCEECEQLAEYRLEKIEMEVERYYEDTEGNLQMELKEVVLTAGVCEEHLGRYLTRSYELVGKYVKRGM